MQGKYQTLVTSQFARQESEYILWPIFDFLVIVPILLMHRKNFGYQPKEIRCEVSEIKVDTFEDKLTTPRSLNESQIEAEPKSKSTSSKKDDSYERNQYIIEQGFSHSYSWGSNVFEYGQK